jgi:hypothetical protein
MTLDRKHDDEASAAALARCVRALLAAKQSI